MSDVFSHMDDCDLFSVKSRCDGKEGGSTEGGVHFGVGLRIVGENDSGVGNTGKCWWVKELK